MNTKPQVPRVPRHVLQKLAELRRFVTLETASFAMPGETVTLNVHGADAGKILPIDQFIKERTHSHRESWIMPALEEIEAWANGAEPDACGRYSR